MVKIIFPFTVKHGGRFRPPRKPFEVAESEVDELIARGAKVVTRSAKVLEKASEKVATKSTARQAKTTPQKKR